jgi:tetratricopeptide (TPR) repeat protein
MTTRVYQLAQELGLSKFELIDAINSLELDISVDNAMSALSDDEVAQLKRALKMEAFDPKPVLGVWRLKSLTREEAPVLTEQSHLVIEEQRLWPVRPSLASYISKHPKQEYQIEWKDDVGRVTVTRPGEESHRGLVRVVEDEEGDDVDELHIRWTDGKTMFPRSFKSGGNLAIYEREGKGEISEHLSSGGFLPEPWDLTYQAIELCDEGEQEEALDLFDRALAIDPELAEAYYHRGIAQMDRGAFEAASADFERALEVDEHFAGAREARAGALEDLGEFGQAAHQWHRVARQQSTETFEATSDLAATSKSLDVTVSAQTWIDCADDFVKAGEDDKAVEVLEEFLAEHEEGEFEGLEAMRDTVRSHLTRMRSDDL